MERCCSGTSASILFSLARRGDTFLRDRRHLHPLRGPLAEGLMVDDTVRCPWHHACFSPEDGEALHAPALSPVACWSTELVDDKVFVRGKVAPTQAARLYRIRGRRRGS
jgi:nitrite reductase/ring-hydroxylating ferredoxin subunit